MSCLEKICCCVTFLPKVILLVLILLFKCIFYVLKMEWYTKENCPCIFNLLSKATWQRLRYYIFAYVLWMSPIIAFLVSICIYHDPQVPNFGSVASKGAGSVTDRGYVFAPLIFFGALLVLGSVRSFFVSYDPQIFPTRAVKIWFYTCLCIVFCFMLSILAFFLSLAFVSDENAHKHRVGSLRAVHVLIGSVIILWILVCMVGVSIYCPTPLLVPLCCSTHFARSRLTPYGRFLQFRLCSKEGEVNQRRHVGPAILVNISGGCILTLLAIQISLIVSKLQGAAQYTWGTALTPIWILDAIAICATLIILAAVFKDEELHTPAVTSLYAVVGGWLSLFSSFFFSEILFVAYMDQDANGANNLTPYNVIAPFIVIWGFFFIISIFEFVRYLFGRCKHVVQMCEVRHLKMLYIDRRVEKRVLYGKDAVDKAKVSEKRKKLQEEANVIIDVAQFQEERSSSTSPTKNVQITTNNLRVNKNANNWNSSLLPDAISRNARIDSNDEYFDNEHLYIEIDTHLMEALSKTTILGDPVGMRTILINQLTAVLKIITENHETISHERLYNDMLDFQKIYVSRTSVVIWNDRVASLFGEILKLVGPFRV